ncbi:MAG: hypothetical protein OHK0056_11370 [Bacteriovoracaceae bacterium]
MKNKNSPHSRIYKGIDIRIPSIINLVLAILSISLMVFLLQLASHNQDWKILVFSSVLFSFVGNTAFSLLHEAVHSNFHSNRSINYIFGNILAAFFPTGFSFQKRCHLNHHRQNRTDFEMFEAYHDHDNKTLKTMMLYAILTGVYWTNPPIGALWLMLSPKSLLTSPFAGGDKNYQVGRMGGAGMLRNFNNLTSKEIVKMRLEVLFSLVFQISLFYFFDLNLLGWLACYIGFAIQWSGLQYADHAYSVRDIRDGAWNLKVNPITKAFFLNYHDHLAHHQHPHVPWMYLPKFVEQRRAFWPIYLRMWKGLMKVDQKSPTPIDPQFEALIDKENFS